MKKVSTSLMFALYAILPIAVSAQEFDGSGDIAGFFDGIMAFINDILIPLVFALALIVFMWGMFRFFILGGHNEDDKEKGKSLMLWAIVGFVLMVSIFGVVNLIAGGLGFSGENLDNLPEVPNDGNSYYR